MKKALITFYTVLAIACTTAYIGLLGWSVWRDTWKSWPALHQYAPQPFGLALLVGFFGGWVVIVSMIVWFAKSLWEDC